MENILKMSLNYFSDLKKKYSNQWVSFNSIIVTLYRFISSKFEGKHTDNQYQIWRDFLLYRLKIWQEIIYGVWRFTIIPIQHAPE